MNGQSPIGKLRNVDIVFTHVVTDHSPCHSCVNNRGEVERKELIMTHQKFGQEYEFDYERYYQDRRSQRDAKKAAKALRKASRKATRKMDRDVVELVRQ